MSDRIHRIYLLVTGAVTQAGGEGPRAQVGPGRHRR